MRPIDADAMTQDLRRQFAAIYKSAIETPIMPDDPFVELSDIDDLPTIDVQSADVTFALRRALAHMWYAYVNKDGEHPHEFELEAVREAEALLGKWEDCMSIMMRRDDDGKID